MTGGAPAAHGDGLTTGLAWALFLVLAIVYLLSRPPARGA